MQGRGRGAPKGREEGRAGRGERRGAEEMEGKEGEKRGSWRKGAGERTGEDSSRLGCEVRNSAFLTLCQRTLILLEGLTLSRKKLAHWSYSLTGNEMGKPGVEAQGLPFRWMLHSYANRKLIN